MPYNEPVEKAVYRIIDANFNRGREAARVLEEYCRFVLGNEPLTARAKQLRHQLCQAAAKLDAGRLIAARDSVGDVGRGMHVGDQMVRAAPRRVHRRLQAPEALRTLAETTAVVNAPAAQVFERCVSTPIRWRKTFSLQTMPQRDSAAFGCTC